jgi:hypothetical protein
VRSKACTVFARLEAGIVGSNHTQGMDIWYVCVYVCVCACVFVCLHTGTGLATSRSPVQGVLPTVPDQETEENQPYGPKAGATRKKKLIITFQLLRLKI